MQYITVCCFSHSHIMLYLQDLFVSTIKGISIGNSIVLVDYITLHYYILPSVLWHCWLGGRKGIRPVKNGGWWRWALVSPDGVAPSWMASVSTSVDLPLHHKVQKFSSGTGSPGWSRKTGRKTVVRLTTPCFIKSGPLCTFAVTFYLVDQFQ